MSTTTWTEHSIAYDFLTVHYKIGERQETHKETVKHRWPRKDTTTERVVTVRDNALTRVVFDHEHPLRPEDVRTLAEVRATIRKIEGHIVSLGNAMAGYSLSDSLVDQRKISRFDAPNIDGLIGAECTNEQALLTAWQAREAELQNGTESGDSDDSESSELGPPPPPPPPSTSSSDSEAETA